MTTADLKVRQVGGRVGAEISGVKLSGDLDEDTVASIRSSLLAHKVVFFRGQDHLDDDTQAEFAKLLGRPIGHPTVRPKLENDNIGKIASEGGKRANRWHTDVTFVANYPSFSILRAVVLPPYGGDTIWANTVAAYADLPDTLKELADRLWAVHTNEYDYMARTGDPDRDASYETSRRTEFASTVFHTEHPLVRVHPETQERALLLGGFAKWIVGVSGNDSALLKQLFQSYITKIENTVRWHWELGDVAIWDNRATQHYASADYVFEREMHRITVEGPVPLSVDGRHSIVRVGGESAWYTERSSQLAAVG